MKRTCLYPVLSVVLSVSAVLAAERTYTGADGGDWDTASNWIPEGVPTASDGVVITNGWVSLAQSAAIASLQLSGGTLTVGGATASVASQTPLDPGFAGTLSLTVTGDVTVSGQISVGGLRQAARSVLSVGGDLTLDPGGVLAVYAGPTNAAVSFLDGGARVTVAGTMRVGSGATVYPDCDPVTGAGVVFDLGAIELGKGGSFNAESRGFHWTEYTGSAPAGSVTWANEGKTYYTFAPGRGRDVGAGGGYGGPGGGMSTYGDIPYGYTYGTASAPYLPGSPSGLYGEAVSRGGGLIRIQATNAVIDGLLSADDPIEDNTSYYTCGAAGGAIWILADAVQFGRHAHLRARGGASANYAAAGGGGRICVSVGLDDTQLAGLVAGGPLPAGFTAGELRGVAATARGGHGMGVLSSTRAGTVCAVYPDASLVIVGRPAGVGSPSPAYGLVTGEPRDTLSCSVPGMIAAGGDAGDIRYLPDGYILEDLATGAAVTNPSGRSVAVTLDSPKILTWLWTNRQERLQIEAVSGGSVNVGGVPAAGGTNVWADVGASWPSVTAVADAGMEFLCWLGEVPRGQGGANPLSVAADRARTVRPLFRTAAAPTTRAWSGGTAAGDWNSPGLWTPAGIPGRLDDVVIDSGTCELANHAEVGSLALGGAAILRIGATGKTAASTVQGTDHLPLTNGFDEARLVVSGDLAMTGLAALGLGARDQAFNTALVVGGDLRLTGAANILFAAAGPTNAACSFKTGGGSIQVGGAIEVGGNCKVYAECDRLTGAPVVFTSATVTVAVNGLIAATDRGFDVLLDGNDDLIPYPGMKVMPVYTGFWGTYSPGYGSAYNVGASYGGLGGNSSSARLYGLPFAPYLPGSTAGYYIGKPHRGGGAIRIITGQLRHDGTISAGGGYSESSNSGASGGAVWLSTDVTPVGLGTLSAIGGSNGNASWKSGGGGGRISVSIGLSDSELDALMAGEIPAGMITNALASVVPLAIDVRGGQYGDYDGRAQSGTATCIVAPTARKYIDVAGVPLSCGTPVPGYGISEHEVGAEVVCTAPAQGLAVGTDNIRYTCQGYLVSNLTAELASGLTNAVTLTMTNDFHLTWLWAGRQNQLTVGATSNGVARVDAVNYTNEDYVAWVDHGALTPSVEAVPDDGFAFLCWIGEVPDGKAASNPLQFVSDLPRTVTPVFRQVVARTAKVYTGASGGDWETGANWTPEGVPTIDHDVYITNKWVKATGAVLIGSLTQSGGTVTIGGTNSVITAQYCGDPASSVPVGLTTVGDVTTSGDLSIGGQDQSVLPSMLVGGDLNLLGGGRLAVYAGPSAGVTPAELLLSVTPVTVAGTLHVVSGATIYPYNELMTGAFVSFNVNELILDEGGAINATACGYWWKKYPLGDPPAGAYNEGSWYTFAPGRGYSYQRGGGHGGRGGNFDATYGLSYGYPYAPFMAGSPNGCHSTHLPSRGGGTVRIAAAGKVTLKGAITADGAAVTMYGGAAGGGIWITCGSFEASQSASLSAKGGSNNAYTSSGGGGRISVGLGLSEAEIAALAAGETPAGLTYGPLTVVGNSVKGGAAKEISTGVRWYAESGTATYVSSATGEVNLMVMGDPLQGGDPDPGYRTHCYPFGETVTCSVASSTLDPSDASVRYVCQGYVVSNWNGVVAQGTATTVDIEMVDGPLFLTWLWGGREFKQQIVAADGGSIRFDDVQHEETLNIWIAENGGFGPLEAMPDAGCEFLFWTGDVPYGMATNNPLQYVCTVPRSIRPVFRMAEAPATRTWNVANDSTIGDWLNPANWLPVGNIPGKADDVVIGSGVCWISNYVEVASLTVNGSGILRVAARTTPNNARTSVDTANHLPYSGTRQEEARVIVHGDLVMAGTAQMGMGAPKQGYHTSLTVEGDLLLTGANRLLIAAGPLNDAFTHATGTCAVRVNGHCEVATGSWIYPVSDYYTGGSVRFDLNRLLVAGGGGFNAEARGYGWDSSRTPGTYAPGVGYSYTIGAGHGGHGGSYNATYGNTYGYSNAPIQPGSCNGAYSAPVNGGGLIRIHAARVELNGTLNANAILTSWAGGPSGGGIWVTAGSSLKVGATATLTARGGPSNYSSRGGGGRIALGLLLSPAEIGSLQATGELPGLRKVVSLDQAAFTNRFAGVSIDLTPSTTGGNKTSGENGTFVFLDAQQATTLLILR